MFSSVLLKLGDPDTSAFDQTLWEEFADLQHLGTVRLSNSEWASLLHMAPKANSEWRPGGVYH